MEIDIMEFGKRVKAAREAIPTDTGKPLGQAKFLAKIDEEGELGMGQSGLSAVELGSGKVARDRLEKLAELAGIEIPYLTNGVGSEVLENLAHEEVQETPKQAVTRRATFSAEAMPYPSHPVISALAHCSREIEALPDPATRGLVVDVLLRLYVEPFLEKNKEG